MTSKSFSTPWFLYYFLIVFLFVGSSEAFGAGNIASTAKIEGQNWRHGDIEDVLLTLLMTSASGGKKFSKMDVKRVYFGNWLRDYSQAVDVGTVKSVSAEAIRLILWILSFMSFGFATKEFEVTRDRLGCYRPEEHIDNPKDYAENIDARKYDRRLRGPVDERRELSVDERTGLKNYIASEDLGICTSAGLVRELLGKSIKLGRRYHRSDDKEEFHEALRLLGTALHCLEDYSAHSNYTELALIELGERDIFPHVGRDTEIRLRGARSSVYPLVTGTFGGVDFLHSVMGEVSDKAIQSEMQELQSTIESSGNSHNKSKVKDLLDNLPDGLFGGKDEKSKADELEEQAAAANMGNMHITPREPEVFTRQVQQISRQIYPILEYHDEIMHAITETIDNIPVLPDLIEELQEQMSIYIFSLLAPFVLPIIKQVRSELETGSSEIINSSREKQHIIFHDDHSSDPTHSMLSKDHFTNLLNEPAGKVASQTVKWVVPQIVECWDDDGVDVDRTIQRIVDGVFHHPALRNDGSDGADDGRQKMFRVVKEWWSDKSERERDDLRERLSRRGIEKGRNHKEGMHDKGHGCNKPLGMPSIGTKSSGGGLLSGLTGSSKKGGSFENAALKEVNSEVGKAAGKAVGGGALGGIVGGIVGGVGSSLLGGAFGGKDDEKKTYKKEKHEDDGSYKKEYYQAGHHYGDEDRKDRYVQARYQETEYASGGHREEYQRYEQEGRHARSGHGFEASVETRPLSGGGYQRSEERRYERSDGGWQSEERKEKYTSSGERYSQETRHHGSGKYGHGNDSDDSEDSNDSDDDDDYEKKARKKAAKERKKREKRERKYGRRKSDDSDDSDKYRRSGGQSRHDYPSQGQSYGYGQSQSHSQSQSQGYGGGSGYGQRDEYGGSGSGYSSRRHDNDYENSSSRRYGGQSSQTNEYGSGYGSGSGYGHDAGGQSRNEYRRGGGSGGGVGYDDQSRSSTHTYSGGGQSYGGSGSTGYGSSGYERSSGGVGGGGSGYDDRSTGGYDSQSYGQQSYDGGVGGGTTSSGYGRSGYDDDDNDEYGRRQQGGGGYGGNSGYSGSSGTGYGGNSGSGYGGGGSYGGSGSGYY